jgi:hypothetical protein
MDVWKIIDELKAHRDQLAQAIETLEALQKGAPAPKGRRGRKSMSPEERKAVSERMRAYWASQRNEE